jgi:hypothetical protein
MWTPSQECMTCPCLHTVTVLVYTEGNLICDVWTLLQVTKPLLERKRRARINKCLDELKDLMVGALEVGIPNDVQYTSSLL